MKSGPSPASGDIALFESKDFILYALGVGASVTDPSDLKFLYESHEDFSVLPTFTVIPALGSWMMGGLDRIQIPGKTFDLSNVGF